MDFSPRIRPNPARVQRASLRPFTIPLVGYLGLVLTPFATLEPNTGIPCGVRGNAKERQFYTFAAGLDVKLLFVNPSSASVMARTRVVECSDNFG